ncbi:nucleolar protein 14-like [Gigantopelta aegis]|uniref:nucleolar protein 14-like n=1 Tax=Gigantopelta aegis TaxID=1735272 RepID=UPI001B888446|nr:nucleolar protein 14-like [Gigantopelta aegis]
MVAKKKKKFVADKVRAKKADVAKTTNPFEVKINRQKHHVLGQKISKHDRGAPGISRSKAIKKRKSTLLQEYKDRFKSNKFVDKRFGENDAKLSIDEKMLKRFALERERQFERGRYSLNDEEELTHYGQSLSEIEKFEDPVVSDDEDDEDKGKINAKLVSEEHFGGFMKRKDDEEENKTWKERMEEMIAKSKKEKYERQSEREKTLELTEKLDEEWKDVMHLMSSMKPGHKDVDEKARKADEYDITVRELKYEMKGKATDRLKTPEELAIEEKEKLDKMEADRLLRMKGIVASSSTQKQTHFSADDLNDGFILDEADKKKTTVRFAEGKLIKETSDDDTDSNKDVTDDKESDDDEEEEVGEDDDDDDDADDAGDDSYSDIASDSSSDEAEETKPSLKKTDSVAETSHGNGQLKSALKKTPETEEEAKAKEAVIEAAKKELPYIFPAPNTYEDLLELLQGHTTTDKLTIIHRVRACHHPSLAEGNKQKLEILLRLLVQYFGDECLQEPLELSLLDKLTVHLYELTQQMPAVAAEVLQNQILDRQAEFSQLAERRGRRALVVGLDTLLYLKLVSVLFPTSDFRHPVTTPAMLLIGQLLAQCPVKTERDVASGLFLCSLCLQYVWLSKRYFPEAINFLHGVLFLAAEKKANKIERVVPPFKPVGTGVNLLLVTSEESKNCELKLFNVAEVFDSDLTEDELSTDNFRVNAVNSCVHLLQEFSTLYADLPSYTEIFLPVIEICKQLPKHLYPQSLQSALSNLLSQIDKSSQKPRQCLVIQKKKPQPLKMFEPKFEEVWDGKKKKGGGNRKFNEKQRLVHKHKRELKGAIREIRKDAQFLAHEQLKETLTRDAERKRRVRDLHSSLAMQEGDYKKLKKLKS